MANPELKEDRPFSPAEVSQINNLDTARMALRWALERLGLLEKKTADMELRLIHAEKERQEAERSMAASQRILAEREEYFKKVEDMALLGPDAKAGIETLAKRGLEAEHSFETVINGLKRRLALAEDSARRAQSMTESREALLTEREKQWIKEKEDLVERHLATSRNVERTLERQKAELLEELRATREKFDNQFPAMIELERRAMNAEEAAAQSKSALESQKSILAEAERQLMRERSDLSSRIRNLEASESDRVEEAVRRSSSAFNEEKSQLIAEIALWRQKHQNQLSGILDLERRVIAAEEASRRAANTVRAKDASAGEADAERARLEAEVESLRLRNREHVSALQELEGRLASLEAARGEGLPTRR